MENQLYRLIPTKGFVREMRELQEKHAKLKSYVDSGKLTRVLDLLVMNGPNYQTAGNIKKLTGTSGLYEIRIMLSRPAIRLLFAYKGYDIVFLYVFQKQDNSDYNHACEVANRRFESWIRRDKNE